MKAFPSAAVQGWSRRATLATCLVASLIAVAVPASKVQAQALPNWQQLTQDKLSAVWWQWALGTPASKSPFYDDTGVNALFNQPYADLVFLAGTFSLTGLQNGDVLGKVTRSLSIRQGTALFFPLLNSEADNVCGTPRLAYLACGSGVHPQAAGFPKLQAIAAAAQDPATGLYARLTTLPGGPTVNIGYARLQSPAFGFTLPATDNLYQSFGVPVSGRVAPAAADGYFAFLAGTLSPGNYRLEFGGKLPIGSNFFIEEITYNITVTP